MQEHWLLAFSAGTGFHEAGASTFDLNLASSSLLNMLYICTALSDNLGTKVKARNWLKVHWNPLLGPFTLRIVSILLSTVDYTPAISYTTVFITFHLFRLTSTESALIDQVGEFLLHELVDQIHGLFQAFFVRTRHM